MKIKDQLMLQGVSEKAVARENALKCLIIYNTLYDLSEGHVWDSDWSTLAKLACFEGEWYWKPTKIGEIFLLGVNASVNDELNSD